MRSIPVRRSTRGVRRKLLLLAVVAIPAAVVAGTAPVSAAGSNGLCVGGRHCYQTLQAAIDAAHDGDTISLGRGSFAGGVQIEQSVNLVGVSPSATKITGGGPVVTIGSATSTPTVTIANVTITGGLTTSNPQSPNCGPDVPTCGPGYADATALGGGIEAFPGTTVTILHSAVTRNRAVPALSTSSVKATCPTGPCPASFGDAAGIDNWGTMTLIGSSVSDNHASAVQSNGGGIVDEANASLTLEHSRVAGNTASAAGPFGRFVSGGGIFVASGATLAVDNSSIDDNSAELTSSIPHPYPIQDGSNDQANSIGGGIFLSDGSTATLRDSSLDHNNVTVSNPAGEPFGADAALCACGNVDLTLRNSSVDGNTLGVNVLSSADTGPSGPIALEADGNAMIDNSRITHNHGTITTPTGDASTLGAVAFFFGGSVTPTITNSTISNNTATTNAPSGAATIQGVGITNNGPLVLTNDVIAKNKGIANGTSGSAQGGGIWNGVLFGGPDSPLTIDHSRVTNNSLSGGPGVTLQGGGIFTPGFPLTLTNSLVVRNTPDQCFGC
jgi:fibronectin-binding autotransporter adhesin